MAAFFYHFIFTWFTRLQKGGRDRLSPPYRNDGALTTSSFLNGTKSGKREKCGSSNGNTTLEKNEPELSGNKKRKRGVAHSARSPVRREDQEEDKGTAGDGKKTKSIIIPSPPAPQSVHQATSTNPLSLSKLNNVKVSRGEDSDSEKETSQQQHLIHNHPADLILNGNKSFSQRTAEEEEEIGKNGMSIRIINKSSASSFYQGENKYPMIMLPKPDLKQEDHLVVDEEDEDVDVQSNEDGEETSDRVRGSTIHYHPVAEENEDDQADQDHPHHSSYQQHLDEMGQPTRKLRRSRTTFTTFQLHQLERAFEKTQYPVISHSLRVIFFFI